MLIALVLFVVGFYAFQYVLGTDESDSYLAAKLILSGHIPYKDFFTHHMPGDYIISTPLYVVAAGNALAFRLLFCGAMAGWIIANFYLLRRWTNLAVAGAYVVLCSLFFGLSLQYQFLAESMVALLCTTSLILLLLARPARLRQPGWLALMSVMLFFIPLLALSYVYVALILYALAIIILTDSWRRFWRITVIFSAPYIVFCGLLAHQWQPPRLLVSESHF